MGAVDVSIAAVSLLVGGVSVALNLAFREMIALKQ
jgi:hypothetical protein